MREYSLVTHHGPMIYQGKSFKMSSKIDPEFKTRLEATPIRRFDVIIRMDGDPRRFAENIIQHGFLIRYTYSLIKAVAANGLGASVLELANEPWVVKIEPDREVRAMS
jgi:hypothetical protein